MEASEQPTAPTALSPNADAMLTSTHKIAGSLTLGAMLHVGHSGRVDTGAVARAPRLLHSTSPSSLKPISGIACTAPATRPSRP